MEKDPVGSFRLRSTVSERFRERAYSLEKNNIDGIEHYIRYGYKQKKMMEMSGFSAASVAKISRWEKIGPLEILAQHGELTSFLAKRVCMYV